VPLGSVEARRDYIDTRDIAEAILTVLEAADGYQVFNVGTGAAHSVEELVGMLGRILGRHIEIVRDASRLRRVERMLLVADISRIRAATGWAARVTLEESLRDLAEAYGLDGARDAMNAQPTRTPAP
jgi:nucleoside-diphosphate-sugar epimerase